MDQTAPALQWRESTLPEERQQRSQALTEYMRRLTAAVQPSCIILFGSVARGTDRISSDIDLIVIGGQLPARMFDRLDTVNRLKRGLPVSMDVFPYTEAEFAQMLDELHVTALEAMHDGVPLLGEAYFAKMRSKYEASIRQGLTRTSTAWSLLSTE